MVGDSNINNSDEIDSSEGENTRNQSAEELVIKKINNN